MFYRLIALFIFLGCSGTASADLSRAKARMSEDAKLGKPLIAHVTVALCDNASQGIVPVGNGLCDGDVPEANLYWGALYGVKTYFSKHKDWTQVSAVKPDDKRILDRIVFRRELAYEGRPVPVYVVAEAWRGKEIRHATTHYLQLISGSQETISLSQDLQLHQPAHVFAYIGHNGLMDFTLPSSGIDKNVHSTSSAIILACKSDPYFAGYLRETETFKLLTTSGFMAPEAYTLEAAITAWFSGGSPNETHLAAATAYSQYQKAKLTWSEKLFVFDQ